MISELPLDLKIRILKRLPLKSLASFKCVSKLWSSLVSSQGYLFPSPPRLYISLVMEHDDSGIMEEHATSANVELLSLSLESTTSNSSNTNVFDLDWTKKGIGGLDMVVLRGLIFYNICDKPYIYNPTTGQRVTLPTIEYDNFDRHKYFLGYNAGLDQYKILCSAVKVKLGRIYSHHWVFVLEAGSSWKRVECIHPHMPRVKGPCINGVIYYFATRSMYGEYEVISFDLRSEEFNIIQLPHETSDHTEDLELIEYGGKPTLFDCMDLPDLSGMVNLWVLEDTGKWSKKSLVLQPSHMHFFADTMCLIGTTQNGEVILQPYKLSAPYYILYYDLHRNDVRRVDIRGISKKPFDLAMMDTGESIMHLKI